VAEDPLVADLKAFGLEDVEAQTYVRLARLGKARASSLSSALKMNRTTTYRVLDRLKQVGIVESSMTRPVSFIAVEPRKALQLLLDRRKDELKTAENKFSGILEQFTRFYIPAEESVGAKFSILQGNEEIHRMVARMAKSADKKISMITTAKDLGKMYYSGVYEALSAAKSREVAVQIVTEVALPSIEIVRHYDFAEVRHQAASKMKMVVKDDEEVLITVSGGSEEEVALWTYSQSFAAAMQTIINNEFYTGIELAAIAASLRTGKPAESVKMIAGEQEYADNILSLLASAKSEVIIGFNFFPTFAAPAVLEVIRALADRGIKVKVLSMPSADEVDIVRSLHGPVEFRISAFQTDVQVMIVDGKEMLFSNSSRLQGGGTGLNIHTNLTGMVSFLHKIMADIWLDSREYILELDLLQQSIILNDCANLVKAKMRDHGMEIEVGTKILGRSGVLHKFDIISPSTKEGGSRIAVLFLAHSDPEVTGTKLMESKIKMLDCERIDLLIGLLVKPGEVEGSVTKLARAVGLPIMQAGNAETLATAVFQEIEKRY
jgi:sugar-specific transcriptional regulator TrmB